jgi:hypothetical protein
VRRWNGRALEHSITLPNAAVRMRRSDYIYTYKRTNIYL